MVDEKQWASLCEDQETNEELCADQKVKLQMVFSIGFLCIDGSFTLFGTFCDVFGPKVTILTGLLVCSCTLYCPYKLDDMTVT
jgi:hypothetical protein